MLLWLAQASGSLLALPWASLSNIQVVTQWPRPTGCCGGPQPLLVQGSELSVIQEAPCGEETAPQGDEGDKDTACPTCPEPSSAPWLAPPWPHQPQTAVLVFKA